MLYKNQMTLYAFGIIGLFFLFFLLIIGIGHFINRRLDALATRRRKDITRLPERKFWTLLKYVFQVALFITAGMFFVALSGFTSVPLIILWVFFFASWGLLFMHKFRSLSLPPGQFIQLQNMFDEEDDFAIEDDINPMSIPRKHHSFRERFQHYIFTCKLAIRNKKISFSIGIVAILIATCILIFSSSCMCIAFHPFEITTGLSRKLSKNYCAPGTVCNMYFTLGTQSGDFIVNFQTLEVPVGAFVWFDSVGHSNVTEWNLASSKTQIAANKCEKMRTVAELERYVCWADLPVQGVNVTYYLVAGYKSGDNTFVSKEYKIRSIPESGFSFVSGGDMSMDSFGHNLMKIAAEKNPYFAMIGGDITYDNGFAACYKRWDEWFKYWDEIMITSDGYSIPIVAAIGNHEAGGFLSSFANNPYFTSYFPQQTGLFTRANRTTYHTHMITKNLQIVVLDTDIVARMDGDQMQWLANTLMQSKDTSVKIALYHGNLYPSVHEVSTIPGRGRQYWAPLFEMYNLTAAFENHCHAYKRTFPIREQKKADDGVVYLGDGAWGINPRPVIDEWYLEKAVQTRNVYSVFISADTITASALNSNNEIFDTWQKNI